MCGGIDLRELAPPSVGKGAADRVVTLRREAAAFLPAASFELRAPDRATACALAEVLAARRAKQLSAAACDAPAGFDGGGGGGGGGSSSSSGSSLSPARTGEGGCEHLLSGYLAKRGGFVASWKRQWTGRWTTAPPRCAEGSRCCHRAAAGCRCRCGAQGQASEDTTIAGSVTGP